MSTPSTMKGLILGADNKITFNPSLPFPSPTLGSVTVRILATTVNPNLVNMLRPPSNGQALSAPRPLIPGSFAIGRIHATGPDATLLAPGQLVGVESFVRGRDDPNTQIIWGMFDGMTPASKKLHADVWRDGSLAEYCRAPLENTFVLDEKLLCGDVKDGGFGYSVGNLVSLLSHTIPYAGLRSIGLQAGETVLVTPATGHVSGSAVSVALAMGARVIAVSRSASGLEKLKAVFPDIYTAQVTGEMEADMAAIRAAANGRPIDAMIEIGPPATTGSSTITAGMLAVKPKGRIVIMGGRKDANIPIPFGALMHSNKTIKGGFMYEREDIWGLVRLLESGRLRLGPAKGFHVAGSYSLEEWDTAAEEAIQNTGFGNVVILTLVAYGFAILPNGLASANGV